MTRRHHSNLFTIVAALLALAACTPSATPEGTDAGDETSPSTVPSGVEFRHYPEYVGQQAKWMVSVLGQDVYSPSEMPPLLIIEYLDDRSIQPLVIRMNALSRADLDGNEYSALTSGGSYIRLARAGTWRYTVVVDWQAFIEEMDIREPSEAELIALAAPDGFLPYTTDLLVGCDRRVLGDYGVPYCDEAVEWGWQGPS